MYILMILFYLIINQIHTVNVSIEDIYQLQKMFTNEHLYMNILLPI